MKRTGYFFYSFLPLLLTMTLQFTLSIPLTAIALLGLLLSKSSGGALQNPTSVFEQLFTIIGHRNFMGLYSVVYALCAVLLFGFWYFKYFKIPLKQQSKNLLSPGILVGIILMVPSLQILTSFLTSFVAGMFPSWMEYYMKLIESSGLTDSPGALMVLYAVILGPIAEELTFRGVALESAKRAFPFWGANILQAFLFGAFHMNMIQGIYAFFIGLFCGYVYEKGGSIYLSILLHMLFNMWGTFFPSELLNFADNVLGACLLLIGSIFILLLSLTLFHKGQKEDSKTSLESN